MEVPAPLHAPPPLTYQDGLPPFSAPRADLALDANHGITLPSHITPHSAPQPHTTAGPNAAPPSTLGAVKAAPTLSLALSSSPPLASPSQLQKQGSSPSKRHIDPHNSPSACASACSSSSSSALSASSSTRSSTVEARALQAHHADETRMERRGQLRERHLPTLRDLQQAALSSSSLAYRSVSADATVNDDAAVMAMAPAVLVEKQRQRIRELVRERDGVSEELQQLRELFRRLSDDYEEATHEAEAQQLKLDGMQTQHRVAQDELTQLRAVSDQRARRIQEFEKEWGSRSQHLRAQLDAATHERDLMQSQRDACMTEITDLRRQLIQLQGELYEEDVKHREALRGLAATHAQELRAALLEKEEQLQARAAATRHEARLTQQQISQLGASQTAAHEDREALRWRLTELEAVVDKKEHLRGELERLVASLRAQVAEQELQSRADAQRYAQRAQELEQTYQAQLHQEQHRCQMLNDELAASRRALQEAHLQHETLAETHAAHARALTSRAAKQEEELREELRVARAEATESHAVAARHEAAAHRNQREAEALRSAAARQQEERAQLQETQVIQSQQLLRAEGRVEVLKARLQEKEREAELLRCAMEAAAWTRETREAMQHTMAAVMGVPRATAMEWLQQQQRAAEAPQLEWPATQTTPPPSPLGPHQHRQQQRPLAQPSTSSAQGVAVVGSASISRSRSAQTHPYSEGEDQEAVEGADVLHSPVRAASATTRADATRHVETIERTVARTATPPISVLSTSQPHHSPSFPAYAAPPPHRGNGTPAHDRAAQDVRKSKPRVPVPTTAAADATTTLSTSSSFPLRTLSFTSARAVTAHRTPSQPRHQYNVVESEAEEEEDNSGAAQRQGNANVMRGDPSRRRDGRRQETEEDQEVFFDDFSTPSVRQGATQRHATLSMPMRVKEAGKAAEKAADTPDGRLTGSAPSACRSSVSLTSAALHHTPSRKEGNGAQASLASGRGGNGRAAVTPSTPGARAAELLAQLPPSSSAAAAAAAVVAAAAASATSTPFSSASAMVAHHKQADYMSEDEDGLQRYLKETVQQVLLTHRDDLRHPHLPQHVVPGQGVRGHSHYTQLYDGSLLHSSVRSERAEGEGNVEDDFGSVSRPRSMLSVLPWQPKQRPQRTMAPVQATLAAASRANAYNDVNSGGSSGVQGHQRRQGDKSPLVSVQGNETVSPAAGLNKNYSSSCSSTAGSTAHVIDSAEVARRRGQVAAQDRAGRRLGAGVADTLEQLARRQQQLLSSLNNTAAAAADTKAVTPAFNISVVPLPGAAAFAAASDSAQAQLRELRRTQPVADAEEGSDVRRSVAPVSDVTGSDVVALQPRQLSYATTTTTAATTTTSSSAPATATAIHAGWGGDGRDAAAGSALISQGRGQQLFLQGAEVNASTAATPPSAAALSAPSTLSENPMELYGAHAAAAATRLSAVSSPSGQPSASAAPFSTGKLSSASESGPREHSEADARVLVFDTAADYAKAAEGGTTDRKPATGVATAINTGTTTTATASVLTSVSAASSLTQLERQLGQPFEPTR